MKARRIANTLLLLPFNVSVTNVSKKPAHLPENEMIAREEEYLGLKAPPGAPQRLGTGVGEDNAVDSLKESKESWKRGHKPITKIDKERLNRDWRHNVKIADCLYGYTGPTVANEERKHNCYFDYGPLLMLRRANPNVKEEGYAYGNIVS